MLQSIAPYVARYAEVIATITGIDVEVADNNLIRIAGTGMYAQGVGESIEHAGEVYRHVLQGTTSFAMHTPRKHALCMQCKNLTRCRETLSVCTPIMYEETTLGIIGMVCFTDKERLRMLSNLDVYQDFVEQMAHTLSMMLAEQQNGLKTQRLLDLLLQITDNDNRCIVILNSTGSISYMNGMARKSMGISDSTDLQSIRVRRTGTMIHDMEEFEMTIDKRSMMLVGRLSMLDSDDAALQQALVFDPLPQYTQLLSRIAHASEAEGLRAIVGDSSIMRVLKQKVLQIARTPSTVLITGESGTGKEMFARAIHAASSRHDKPFIPINCGAIPDALLESELFGYVSGAFTGANPSGYIGKFELAHQGVLFLDEIGAMPLYLQVKLLRVLQDKRIMRLGSNRIIDVDVRIIAATNERLPELIEQRMFRDDLYYRLNVIPFSIPPLRERLEDLPALAAFFLKKYCQLFDKKAIPPTARLLETLARYHWPGNVREFENIMEYLVNVTPAGKPALVKDLPQKILEATIPTPPARKETSMLADTTGAEPAASLLCSSAQVIPLETLEKEAINNALRLYGITAKGKQMAAEALGIGIATLYRKIKHYKLRGAPE